MSEKILGVLGGMGPAASAEFLKILAEKYPAEKDQDHPVVYMISDPKMPDRGRSIAGEGEDPEPFDMVKFGGTVIIGVGVGVALANTGVQVTDSAIQNGLMIGTTMGFTALIENGIRGLYRAITGKR